MELAGLLKEVSISLSHDDLQLILDQKSDPFLDTEVASPEHRPARSSNRRKPENAPKAAVDHQQVIREQEQRSNLLKQLEDMHGRLAEALKEKHVLESKVEILKRQSGIVKEAAIETVYSKEIEELKSQLPNLLLTELQYVELQSVPVQHRSLLDMVRIQVFEDLHEIKSRMNKLKQEAANLDPLARENSTLKLKLRNLEETLKLREESMTARDLEMQRLKTELEESNLRLKDARVLSSSAEEIRNEREQLRAQNMDLMKQNEHLKSSVIQLNSDLDSLRNEKLEVLKQVDILKLDKSFLQKENDNATRHVQELENRLQQRTADLEASKENHLNQFQESLRMTEKSRAEYEKRLQEELAAIRQRAHLDLEDVRKNTREFYEREIIGMREKLTSSTSEVHYLQNQVNEYRDKLHEAQLYFTNERSRLESELAGLAQQVKMKAFESERFRVIYEDSLSSLKTAQLENEKLMQKLNFVHREYQEVQIASRARILELETQLKLNPNGSLGDDKTRAAQKKTVYEVESLKHEIRVMENMLSRTREPYSSLIQEVRRREKELFEANHTRIAQTSEIQDLKQKLNSVTRDRESVLHDLHLVTQNQKKLDEVRELLMTILQNPRNEKLLDAKKSLIKMRRET